MILALQLGTYNNTIATVTLQPILKIIDPNEPENFSTKALSGHLIDTTGIGLGMHPVNERRGYNVTTSLIGWAHT